MAGRVVRSVLPNAKPRSPRRSIGAEPAQAVGTRAAIAVISPPAQARAAEHGKGKQCMPLYDAFISYSHAKDKPIAAALQSVIQRLGKAWYQRRALRVFRDDTSLSATPHLWPS